MITNNNNNHNNNNNNNNNDNNDDDVNNNNNNNNNNTNNNYNNNNNSNTSNNNNNNTTIADKAAAILQSDCVASAICSVWTRALPRYVSQTLQRYRPESISASGASWKLVSSQGRLQAAHSCRAAPSTSSHPCTNHTQLCGSAQLWQQIAASNALFYSVSSGWDTKEAAVAPGWQPRGSTWWSQEEEQEKEAVSLREEEEEETLQRGSFRGDEATRCNDTAVHKPAEEEGHTWRRKDEDDEELKKKDAERTIRHRGMTKSRRSRLMQDKGRKSGVERRSRVSGRKHDRRKMKKKCQRGQAAYLRKLNGPGRRRCLG